ncbi:unnamed protein product [Paramecium sonneborni]|uniref:Transmembrane protein n=1 Tax=Paramecium sonneborni TaxID=65129 RepID=A0A8S1QQH8_9CILI|nr:unnamed protein product [Paramecium sonneborni]
MMVMISPMMDVINANNCQICEKGKCKQFQLLDCDDCQNEICQLYKEQIIQEESECGDGLKQEQEECDDGNNLNNDGCSDHCFIENGWNCTQFSYKLNQCYKITLMQLTYLFQHYEVQQIKLSYTNEVKLDETKIIFIDNSSFFISQLKNEQYNIKVTPRSNLTQITVQQTRKVDYIIDIIFHENLDSKPILTVNISALLWDINSMPIYPNTQQFELLTPQIISSTQLERSITIKYVGLSLQIGLSGYGAILLMTGQIMQFLDILDILQYQSYLKYVNVNYPENLQIYFDSSNFLTLSPILNYFKIVQLFNSILGENVLMSIGKFNQYEINADFLTNIQAQILQLASLIILFLLSLQKYNLFNSKCFSEQNSNLLKYLQLKLYLLQKSIVFSTKVMSKEKLLQMFHVNSQDLIFKVLLFLFSNTTNSTRQQISNYICIIFLTSTFFIMIRPIRNLYNKINRQINIEQQYESIILMRKLLFFLFLIGTQNHPLLECLMLSFSFALNLILITYCKLIKQKVDLVFVFWVEIPVIAFIQINNLYCQDFSNHIPYSSKINLGFFQIGLLIFGILGPLVKSMIQLYDRIKKTLQKREKQQKNIQTIKIFAEIKI